MALVPKSLLQSLLEGFQRILVFNLHDEFAIVEAFQAPVILKNLDGLLGIHGNPTLHASYQFSAREIAFYHEIYLSILAYPSYDGGFHDYRHYRIVHGRATEPHFGPDHMNFSPQYLCVGTAVRQA
jgi:hypothetical protein